jgi:hypothetical protein
MEHMPALARKSTWKNDTVLNGCNKPGMRNELAQPAVRPGESLPMHSFHLNLPGMIQSLNLADAIIDDMKSEVYPGPAMQFMQTAPAKNLEHLGDHYDMNVPYKEIIAILNGETNTWNAWRTDNPGVWVDFRNADLRNTDLTGKNLGEADFQGASLSMTRLVNTNFSAADLGLVNGSLAILQGCGLPNNLID